MHLDNWLKQVYEEDVLGKNASGLEALFDKMQVEDLLDVACGRTSVEKVAAKMSLPAKGKEKQAAAVVGKKAQPKSPSIDKTASAKLAFVDRLARELAHTHAEVVKQAQGEPDWYTRQLQAQQAAHESPALQGSLGALAGGLAGHSLGTVHGGHGLMGGLIGAGLGGGLGLLGSHLARRRRAALALMGPPEGMDKQQEYASPMTKEDEFTSPEAQEKAKVMQQSMQMAKGAAPPVRKKAVAAAGKAISTPGQ